MLDEELTLLKALSEKPRVVCGGAIETAQLLKKKGFATVELRDPGEYECAITDQGAAALAAVSLS
jgi:hypothetical protein